MTATGLIKGLAEEVRVAVRDIKMAREYQSTPTDEDIGGVNVFEQVLPRDWQDRTTYFPLILVELISVEDDLKNTSTARAGITVATFSKEYDAWQDCLHICEVVREHLLARRVISRRYRLTNRMVLELPESQPTPFFFASIFATYGVYQVQGARDKG